MRYKTFTALMALSLLYTSDAIPMPDSPLTAPLLKAKYIDSPFREKYSSTLGLHTHSIDTGSMDMKFKGGRPTLGLMNAVNPELSIRDKVIGVLRDHIHGFRHYPSLGTLAMHKRIANQMAHEENDTLQDLAGLFLNFGDLFVQRSLEWDTETKKNFVVPCIHEGLKVLDVSDLKPRQRLWILGMLLRVKNFLPKDSRSYLKDFRHGHRVSRGEAELFLVEGE